MGTTTVDNLFKALKSDIYSGELGPGTALRQEEIADKYKVSRIPVRESLLKLEAENLIRIESNRGAFVIQMDRNEIKIVYDLRILVECDILSRAIPLMTPTHIKKIQYTAKIEELNENGPDWIEKDMDFHFAMYSPANRQIQIDIIERLRNTSRWFSAAYHCLHPNSSEFIQDHRNLIKACEGGDVERGVEVLRSHISNAAKVVLENI